MFPLSDTAPSKRIAFINYLIIAINMYVFYLQISSSSFEHFTYAYAFIPANFSLMNPASYIPILSSLFMHGGFLHILSNMWFLYIFGDNIEDRLGHIGYALFYLLGGVFAALIQYFISPSSIIPVIGASGAISAVIGAYFIWYGRYQVRTLVPTLFSLWDIVDLPVWLFLGYWIIIQLFSGLGSLAILDINQGGIAWFAHIGGFIFGFLIAKLA